LSFFLLQYFLAVVNKLKNCTYTPKPGSYDDRLLENLPFIDSSLLLEEEMISQKEWHKKLRDSSLYPTVIENKLYLMCVFRCGYGVERISNN